MCMQVEYGPVELADLGQHRLQCVGYTPYTAAQSSSHATSGADTDAEAHDELLRTARTQLLARFEEWHADAVRRRCPY